MLDDVDILELIKETNSHLCPKEFKGHCNISDSTWISMDSVRTCNNEIQKLEQPEIKQLTCLNLEEQPLIKTEYTMRKTEKHLQTFHQIKP